jgi:hypothetical protein
VNWDGKRLLLSEGINMNTRTIAGLESKLETLLNYNGEVTPDSVNLEEEVSLILAQIDDALNGLRTKIHRELYKS